jgi:hypothetical protein
VCASCSPVQFWYFDDDPAWRGVGVQLYLKNFKDVLCVNLSCQQFSFLIVYLGDQDLKSIKGDHIDSFLLCHECEYLCSLL